MGRTHNPKIVRRKSNVKRTYNKPSAVKTKEEFTAYKGKAETPEKLEKKSKKDK
jgi:hypothetical protein